MDLSNISATLASLNEPSFRIKQITKDYFSGRYQSFLELTDLPLNLRQQLDQSLPYLSVKAVKNLSDSFTQKALLELKDGLKIESVLMDYDGWLTACISSQVGCPLNCSFCATGKMGLKRQLSTEEIVDQILFWNHLLYPKFVGRVVFMGMGEPFLNWDNFINALKVINHPDMLNLGQRKVSVSTAGVAPRIIDFANLDTQVNLAVSLHSADQETREKLMPIAKVYSLDELKKSLDYYVRKTNRQVFFEYALIKDQNDSPRHLQLLSDFILSNHLFFLNLIPLNPIPGGLDPTPPEIITNFVTKLTKNHVNFTVRHSLGQSIQSACGQLITEN